MKPFSDGEIVCLIAAPNVQYTIVSSEENTGVSSYDPPIFYRLEAASGAIVYWPHSCLQVLKGA